MQVRFRILKGHYDAELSRVAYEADKARNPFSVEGKRTERESVPQAISATEGTATLAQLRVLIEGGDLKLRDLVNVGNGWEPLEDCLQLDELTAPFRRRAARLKLLMWWGGAALIFGAMVAMFLSLKRI
jgi:hypothetical protein